jgi:hypothetical protein
MLDNTVLIIKTFTPLNGKSFYSKDELEDAVFPLYSRADLSSRFTGEGHRDMVDRLIRSQYVVLEGNKYVVRLPITPVVGDPNQQNPEAQAQFETPASQTTVTTEFTYDAINLLTRINDEEGVNFDVDEDDLVALTQLGLIKSDVEQDLKSQIEKLSPTVITHVNAKEWGDAIDVLENILELESEIEESDDDYVLTDLGKAILNKLKKITIKL